jgi:DNA-binding transcriptional MerR regulator
MEHYILPDQNGISIGDVSKICQVPTYTIRYWEKEFRTYLAPDRTTGKQRRYRTNDISRLLEIKKLLWINKFTIEGARMLLDGQITFPFLAQQQN